MRLGGIIDIRSYVASLPPLGCSCRKTYGVTPNSGLLDSGLLVYLLLLPPHCRKPETCALIDTLGAWKPEYLHPDSAAAGPEPLNTALPILLPPLPRTQGETPCLLPLLHRRHHQKQKEQKYIVSLLPSFQSPDSACY